MEKKSGHISSISYTYDPNVLILIKTLHPNALSSKMWHLKSCCKVQNENTVQVFLWPLWPFSDHLDTWKFPAVTVAEYNDEALHLPWSAPVGFGLLYCSCSRSFENVSWPVWSLTINSGYTVDLSQTKHILHTCCNYRACHNLYMRVPLFWSQILFHLLRIPQSWDGAAE